MMDGTATTTRLLLCGFPDILKMIKLSMMFKIVWTRATSTHHKLALAALRHLQGPDSANWYDLFLKHHSAYLEGAKDPDKKFHDFKNRVIHVRENYWGGAFAAAEEWYNRLVEELKNKKWKDAVKKRKFSPIFLVPPLKFVYSAGVLSQYAQNLFEVDLLSTLTPQYEIMYAFL